MGRLMHINQDYTGSTNIIPVTQAEYEALTPAQQQDPNIWYYITDRTLVGAPLDDGNPSENKVWSSEKVSDEITSIKSHVGMIIHSTTLDTMQKVIDVYGGTTWIQHTGYVLRGASSGVVANSAAKTGGNDDAIVPYHRHSVAAFTNASNGTCTATGGNHRHAVIFNATGSGDYFSIGGAQKFGNTSPYAYGGYSGNLSLTVPNHAHTISAHNTNYEGTSGNTTNANIPNYKSVYIWERTA